MNQRLVVADALAVCVARLGAVLMPWGFSFQSGDVDQSHNGPFASGYYVRDATRIGLSCRDTIDNLDYEHSFVTVHAFSRESERFRIGRATLMRAAGHADDCWLIECKEIPDVIKARN